MKQGHGSKLICVCVSAGSLVPLCGSLLVHCSVLFCNQALCFIERGTLFITSVPARSSINKWSSEMHFWVLTHRKPLTNGDSQSALCCREDHVNIEYEGQLIGVRRGSMRLARAAAGVLFPQGLASLGRWLQTNMPQLISINLPQHAVRPWGLWTEFYQYLCLT